MTSDGKFIQVLGDMIVLYNETPQQIHFEDRCTAACCKGEILLAVIRSQDGSMLLCYRHINGKFHEIGGESFTPALTAVTIDGRTRALLRGRRLGGDNPRPDHHQHRGDPHPLDGRDANVRVAGHLPPV